MTIRPMMIFERNWKYRTVLAAPLELMFVPGILMSSEPPRMMASSAPPRIARLVVPEPVSTVLTRTVAVVPSSDLVLRCSSVICASARVKPRTLTLTVTFFLSRASRRLMRWFTSLRRLFNAFSVPLAVPARDFNLRDISSRSVNTASTRAT